VSSASTRLAQAMASAAAACLCAACAGTGLLDPPAEGPGTVRTPAGASMSPQAAIEKVAIGKSTKADVAAALGAAIVIPFDSGHEVWVYRWAGPERTTRSATELVLLFDPAGRATKARLRPGYATRD
jgi:hypothetical protein